MTRRARFVGSGIPDPAPDRIPADQIRRKKFDPDWVVAPGETLKDWMTDNGVTVRIGAALSGLDRDALEGVLAGTTPITPEIAENLYTLTGVSTRMWLALEHNFRVGLAAGKKWTP